MKPQVLFVAGARPNFMKIAPLLRAHEAAGSPFDTVLVHTGQHYDAGMSDVFFRDLGLPEPDVHLGVGSAAHGVQTAAVVRGFAAELSARDPAPAGVVVVGDVNSTLACSLAAFRAGVPVAHVEAGLRSFDRTMPEEINRIVTDTLSDLLFVTEPDGKKNLLDEGTPESRIHDAGDVMIDSLFHEVERAGDTAPPEGLELHG
ncbi:MAG: UDP-N-acetyl glucosamine 2-epimerase, partial [Planctomycetota bacterium]